jgi:hypothetical protein
VHERRSRRTRSSIMAPAVANHPHCSKPTSGRQCRTRPLASSRRAI